MSGKGVRTVNIYEATKIALQGQGKITRGTMLWTFSHINVKKEPVQIVSARVGHDGSWNPTYEDLIADDWEAI